MTGAELLRITLLKTDQAYSGYWDNTRWNRAFKEAFINVLNNKYLAFLNNQGAFDEMTYFIKTARTFPVNPINNTIYLGTHSFDISAISISGNTLFITTALPNDLITGTDIIFRNINATGTLPSITSQLYSVTVVDEYTFYVTTAAVLTGVFTSGSFDFANAITDYYHYLRAEVTFTKLTKYTVTASTNATPIKITLNKRSKLRTGEKIVVADIFINTNANGIAYLKQANEKQYFLYSDQELTIPKVGNGDQTGIGTVSQMVTSTLRFKRSDEKGSVYGEPSVDSPFFQQSTNTLVVLPSTPCSSINIDYIRTPTFFIDVNDAVTDLTLFFNLNLQYLIVDEAAKMFAASTRDMALYQTSSTSIIQNP